MKNQKVVYYVAQTYKALIPKLFLKNRLSKIDSTKKYFEQDYVDLRVNYYNKLENSFELTEKAVTLQEFKREKKKTYFFDLYEYLRYFDSHLKIAYLFGDVIDIPKTPTLLKSRPIEGDNENSILMNLNKVRHFTFVNDRISFKDKKDLLVWRGNAYQSHRKEFVKKYYNCKSCDIGQTNRRKEDAPWQKPRMSIKDQLKFKFILSIEGNDVASNLKWIMSSNSLAFMAKPKYETWFMEGRLIPNHHYVLVKDDYSDLEEKIEYYIHNEEEALQIIHNANSYVEQFKEKKRETLISVMVLQKYFEKSKQI